MGIFIEILVNKNINLKKLNTSILKISLKIMGIDSLLRGSVLLYKKFYTVDRCVRCE